MGIKCRNTPDLFGPINEYSFDPTNKSGQALEIKLHKSITSIKG
jgi:hypothetical protein